MREMNEDNRIGLLAIVFIIIATIVCVVIVALDRCDSVVMLLKELK